jgi:uncharacterized protein (TIGR03643 family)
MKKKSLIPQTKVKNPEPNIKDDNWIVWAESDVIKIMRKNLKPESFRLWRKRAHKISIKHRKKFKLGREKIKQKIRLSDIK